MTPHRSNNRGTLVLDRRFPAPIGRLRLASKLDDPEELAVFLDTMLPALREQAQDLDVLRAIQQRRVTVKESLKMWRDGTLHTLAAASRIEVLHEALHAYERERHADEGEDSEHLRKMRTTANHLRRLVPRYRVRDMRDVLPVLKAGLEPSSFNQVRAHLQAFARDVLGKSSAAYEAIRDSRRKRTAKRKRGRPYGRDEVKRAVRDRSVSDAEARMIWTLCTTGMMPEEYWEEARCRWELRPDRLHIAGTKREARDRDVPIIVPPFRPVLSQRKFTALLKRLFGPTAMLYDTRRTYARWMAEARILGINRKAYMGHAVTITELYEMGEVEGQLAQDTATMRTYLQLDTEPPRAFGVVK